MSKPKASNKKYPYGIQEFVAKSDFFSELHYSSIERIARRMRTKRYKRDGIVCREGDEGNSMFIIVSGEVAILKDVGWGQRELGRMGAGESFGEMALISNEHRTATVKALENTLCLQLDEADFDALLDQDSHFAQRVAKILTQRLAEQGTESSKALASAYRALITSLAGLAESRDPETGAHLERTRGYCTLLADLALRSDRYRAVVRPELVDGINYVSPLHDIGKVSIPDNILLKPAKLTSAEFEIMKSHTTAGAAALKNVLDQSDLEVFQMAYRVCLHHHERWDGTGYPIGFSGEEIPIEARIMSIADVFDALLSQRVYKPALTYDEALSTMMEASGTQFDPVLLEIFTAHIDQLKAIHRQYSGESP